MLISLSSVFMYETTQLEYLPCFCASNPPLAAPDFVSPSTVAQTRSRAAITYKARCSADCMFSALRGDSIHRVITIINSNTFFKSCIFRDLSEERQPENSEQGTNTAGAFTVFGLNATLVLENCTLTDIVTPLPLVVSHGGLVYSDNPEDVVRLHHHQSLD